MDFNSELWKVTRQAVLRRDRNACQECGRHRELAVYRVGGGEITDTTPVAALVTMCVTCGGVPTVKAKRRKLPVKKYPPKCKTYTPAEVAEYGRLAGKRIDVNISVNNH